MSRLISIVTVAHLAEDYSDGWYYRRIIVWFTRIPVRVNLVGAVDAVRRFASWLAVKTRVD